jgi:glycosyltransferase involved in cell wall biosynthesis
MDSKKIKVALLLPDDRFGKNLPFPVFGAAPTALLQGFEDLGSSVLEVHVISCVIGSVPAPEKLADNIWYHQIELPKWCFLRSLHLGAILAVRNKLKQINPDLVHSHGIERWCGVAGSFSGFPAILTIHGHLRLINRVTPMKPRAYWLAQMLLGEFAISRHTGVVCISNHIASAVKGQSSKTWVIPNPVREQFFVPLKDAQKTDPINILVVGTIVENKQPLEILNVLTALYNKGCRFKAIFVGELSDHGDYQKRFRFLINKADALGYAQYGGRVSINELITLMDSSSALIHFPLEEAFGLVVAESLARGLKLFASSVGGIRDIAQGITDAVLLKSGDFSRLEKSLASWIDQGAPMSKGASIIMKQRYLPNLIAKYHLKAYREVLDSKVIKSK